MNITSFCDGISCGQLALQRAGIAVSSYRASEISHEPIKVTQAHFPETVQLGDLKKLDLESIGWTDLLMAGTPCQNLSRIVIDRIQHNTGLAGDKSNLFYLFYKAYLILREKNPKLKFLLENVVPNSGEDRRIISDALGVQPIVINSNQFSAQDRVRLYWTNISIAPLPPKSPLVLADIIQPASDVPVKYWYKADQPFLYHGDDEKVQCTLQVKTHEMLQRVYNLKHKAPTLTCVTGGYQQKKVYQNSRVRKLTPLEYERLQTVPDNYTAGFSDTARYSMLGNGWTVDVLAHIFRGLKNHD